MNSNRIVLALIVGISWASQSVCFATLVSSNDLTAATEERTIEEFKEYLAEKIPNLSDEQLEAIGQQADVDGDGEISEEEFDNRMEAVRTVMARPGQMDEDEQQETDDAEKQDAAGDENAAGDDKESDENADESDKKSTQPTKPTKPKNDDEQEFQLPSAEVLIVTSGELAEAWQDFAIWKTKTGRPTKIITTDHIEEEFEGDDIQQKIRLCCLQHISDSGTRFVILGGDSEGDGGQVPDRDTDHSECKMLPYDNIPTDLYYVSEKDWDANDDGVYGKFEDDMDAVTYTNPNACIGRIPVRTAKDVQAYTNKVIAYESKYPVGQFANRMVYTCPEKFAYKKLGTSTEQLAENWENGTVSKFYGNETPWDDQKKGDHDLTSDNWVKMINERGAAKMHMHGHGILPFWVLESESKVTKSTVADLENENAYPIITTVSCLTGQYDNRQDPSISEAMIRQPNAGAIAVLAPSREGVPFMLNPRKDMRLMMTEGKMDGTTTAYTKFWISALKDRMTIGEAFKQVKMDMESMARQNDGFHMLQCELNLLGDPTLDPRPEPPTNLDGRVRVRDNTIVVRGFTGATLCIWNGSDHYEIVNVGDSRITTIDLEGKEGTYSVAAYGSGFNTWLKEGLEVEAEEEEEDAEEEDAEEKAETETE